MYASLDRTLKRTGIASRPTTACATTAHRAPPSSRPVQRGLLARSSSRREVLPCTYCVPRKRCRRRRLSSFRACTPDQPAERWRTRSPKARTRNQVAAASPAKGAVSSAPMDASVTCAMDDTRARRPGACRRPQPRAKAAQTGGRGRTSLDRPERGRADPSPTGTSIRACAPCERTTGRRRPPPRNPAARYRRPAGGAWSSSTSSRRPVEPGATT